jgi:hypothetical protein
VVDAGRFGAAVGFGGGPALVRTPATAACFKLFGGGPALVRTLVTAACFKL